MRLVTAFLLLFSLTNACRDRGDGSKLRAGEGCAIGGSETANNDPLFKILSTANPCPKNVLDFRKIILADGLKLMPSMVANRGFHNSRLGSFSFFEMVEGKDVRPGDFFFGHFTGTNATRQLVLDAEPAQGKLMIELVVWDTVKGVFNFYEMIGAPTEGRWFYRGDSNDVMGDIATLHRQTDPARPKFGSHLRCSGCHTNGGPIMKEFSAPHNDWWLTNRKLPVVPNQPDATVAEIMTHLVDADVLAKAVSEGQKHLFESAGFNQGRSKLSLQEQLRPLFCPVEMTIASDETPNDKKLSPVSIPAGFVADADLTGQKLSVARDLYSAALAQARSKFPETNLTDSDHAWLTPVKAPSDLAMVRSLVQSGVIDEEFIADVLAIDFTNPTISPKRCQLLRFLPVSATPTWRKDFKTNLAMSASSVAQDLSKNLEDETRNRAFHQKRAAAFLGLCQTKLKTQAGVTSLVRLLGQRRSEVFASEISQNPRGQIFEPGFRVIFPDQQPAPKPQALELSEGCEVL